MSAELLADASINPCFDPTPPPGSLAAAHVSYRLLVDEDLEGAVAERLANYQRLALVGPIGSGKSSLAHYLLRPNGQALAPIWINVATEAPDRVSTVRGFLELLASQLLRKAQNAARLSAGDRTDLLRKAQSTEPLGVEQRKRSAQVGGSYWLLKGDVATELTRTMDHGAALRSVDEVREVVQRALEVLSTTGLIPVLVADDTDRLLSVAANADLGESLFQCFFGEILRELSTMECGLLVAAHDRYTERPDYGELTEGRLSSVELPRLEDASQFGRMITARVEFIDTGASWRDLVTEEALDNLAELHRTQHDRSIRRTLTTLREALGMAASDDAAVADTHHM